jgi:iron complex outermembrane receptor protein
MSSSSLGRCLVLFGWALLLVPSLVAAEEPSVVLGRVSDPSGAAVPQVRVELEDGAPASRFAVTDEEGRYRFEAVAPGDYVVRVAVPGLKPEEQQVRVASAATATADFTLALRTLSESIRVTAERDRIEVEAQRALTPGGVTIVDGDDLFRRSTNGLADMLRYVPGMWAESASGSEELFFSSRGSNLDAVPYDKNGVKMLQDGLPVTTADGNNHNRVVDPLSASYASVARGANALTYGASTLGGAIDFVSPTASSSPPVSLFVNGGSHGALDGRATVGAAQETLDGLLTLETKQWDGFRGHSDQNRWGIYANSGWQPSEALSLRAFATYVDNDQRLPGALTRAEADADPDQASADAIGGNYGKVVKTGRLATKAAWTLAGDRFLTAGLSYEEQSLFHPIVDRILIDFDGPGPNPPVEVFSLLIDTDHRDFGAVVRYDQTIGAHDVLLGVNYGNGSVEGGNYRNLGGRPNGLAELVDNRADGFEWFATDRWRATDRVTVELGVQFVDAARDVRTTNVVTGAVSHPEDRFTSFNPRIGAIVALDDSGELYGNVSRLFEAPTTFQMEDDVRGGNAILDPMQGVVAEAGWRSRSAPSGRASWSWDVSAYYARIQDEILSVDDPNAPGNSLTTNVDDTVHAGLEALVSASIEVASGHRLAPRVSVSLNHFKFDGDPVYGDNRLPAAPKYTVRGELLYRHGNGLYLGPTFDFVGERYADFANTYSVDSHALAGLRAGFSGGRWELFGELRNLFDEEYTAAVNVFDVAGGGARALYPGEPRSVYAGVRFWLDR